MIKIMIINTSIAHFNIGMIKNESYIEQTLYYLMYVLILFTVSCYTNN